MMTTLLSYPVLLLVPTAQLKAVVDIIAPFLTELFNRSLASGFVPEVFKAAYITPLLKKSDMDPADQGLTKV